MLVEWVSNVARFQRTFIITIGNFNVITVMVMMSWATVGYNKNCDRMVLQPFAVLCSAPRCSHFISDYCYYRLHGILQSNTRRRTHTISNVLMRLMAFHVCAILFCIHWINEEYQHRIIDSVNDCTISTLQQHGYLLW